MTSVYQIPEKDAILKLLKDPLQDSQLYGMSLAQLDELEFGIRQLATLYQDDPEILQELNSLGSRVGLAHNHLSFMKRLDAFLENLRV